MKKIQFFAANFFIIAVSILTVISVMGIWKIFDTDVITKSFETLGLLAVVAVIVIVAVNFIEGKKENQEVVAIPTSFKAVRKATLTILIVAVSFLALLGILSIWNVITDKAVLGKTIGSLVTLVFSSLIIVVTCLSQEGDMSMMNAGQKKVSGMTIVLIIVGAFVLLQFLPMLFYGFR